ncbi:MAG: hypothetical protein IPL89_07085 [Acidobacteria bacterium]|nr:hypothetical protein [Acidobacteriota bacterium]
MSRPRAANAWIAAEASEAGGPARFTCIWCPTQLTGTPRAFMPCTTATSAWRLRASVVLYSLMQSFAPGASADATWNALSMKSVGPASRYQSLRRRPSD